MSGLNLDALGAWMRAEGIDVGGGLEATKFAVGQSNPTYLVQDGAQAWVLRRKPPGQLLKSAHAIDREFRVQHALRDTAVPVPEMIAYCADETVIGSAFYVMQKVEGQVFDDPRFPQLGKAPKENYFNEMARVLAAIHEVDLSGVGLADYGPSGNYFRRQIDRWSSQYAATQTDAVPDMDALIKELDASCPAEDGAVTLVHGDYRLDNLLFSSSGPEIVAVLDWELSTLGHPLADLGAVIMQWQMPPGDQGRGLGGVDREALGLMSDKAFVDAYTAHRGIAPIENMSFYVAFAFFRMAAILQGVKKRALDGNASNPERAMELGALVPEYASAGLQQLRG